MSVHYKFKSTLDFDTITFDGLHISVGDLKRAIVQQKRLGKLLEFDLQITNAQTKEEYNDESSLVPKNTSLIIARVPLAHPPKKGWDPQSEKPHQHRSSSTAVDSISIDLSKMKGTEEDKIQAMMLQSTVDYDPKSYQRLRGQSQFGDVPATYRCNKCKKAGHWIRNCPLSSGKEQNEIKRNTGIPKSFRDKDDKTQDIEIRELPPPPVKVQEIPDDLLCSICNDIFVDAVMIPCCGSSFCDDCVRTALLESEDNECPDCKEKGSSPGSLIPNRFLRNSVNSFKNETGYKSIHQKKDYENISKKQDENKIKSSADVPSFENSALNEDSQKMELPKIEYTQNKEKNDDIKKQDSEKTTHISKSTTKEEIDSDYEDNITVKMPTAQMENQRVLYHEKTYSGRNSWHINPPGIDRSPLNNLQGSPLDTLGDITQKSPKPIQYCEWERDTEPHCNEQGKEARSYSITGSLNNCNATPQIPSALPNYSHSDVQERPVISTNSTEIFNGSSYRVNSYEHPHNSQLPQGVPMHGLPVAHFNNSFNQMVPRVGIGYHNRYQTFVRPMFQNMRPNYISLGDMSENQRQPLQTCNLASMYQGIAEKVGTGIIDDPLEAFNRIMKEKEKRREERRRVSDHHRSRSKERQQRSHFRSSPYNRRLQRQQPLVEKRGRSRERIRRYERSADKHSLDKIARLRRSNSFSDRSSRSRSHSPVKKRSRSPFYKRRSRSRGNAFGNKRSRSRERVFKQQQNVRSLSDVVHDDNQQKGYKNLEKRSTAQQVQQKIYFNADKTEALEPPPPGFEETFSNHSRYWEKHEQKKITQNSTPDLYESYLSQDLEERSVLSTRSRKNRSRSKSKSVIKNAEKRNRQSNSPPENKTNQNREHFNETALNKIRINIDRKRNKNQENDKIKTESDHIYSTEFEPKQNKNVKSNNYIIKGNKNDEKGHKYAVAEEKSFFKLDNDSEKAQKLSDSDKEDNRSEKKSKEHRKKRKERNDRKKIKKDKKDKRDKRERDKQKNLTKQIYEYKNISVVDEKELKRKQYSESQHHETSEKITNNKVSQKEQQQKEPPPTKIVVQINDLYKDFVDENDTLKNHISERGTPPKITGTILKEATPPDDIKRFDSVLDIQGYDTDFDEANFNEKLEKTGPPMPAPSKWEQDEPIITVNRSFTKSNEDNYKVDCVEIVTNDVLRKAENAIFARAINAIRPLDIKKCKERHSPYIEHTLEIPSETYKNHNATSETLVASNRKNERLLETKEENKMNSTSPFVKSIRDRLGSKITSNSESPQTNSRHIKTNRFSDYLAPKNGVHKNEKERVNTQNNTYKSSKTRSYIGHHDRDYQYHYHRSDDNQKSYGLPHTSHDSRVISKEHSKFSDEKIPDVRLHSSRTDKSKCAESFKKFETSLNYTDKNKKVLATEAIENQSDNLKRNSEIGTKFFIEARSSTPSTETGSKSDSDDTKRKKKHKYKKGKKRSKRSSSMDSVDSTKKKHSKSRKKNKTTKKRKRSKK